MSEEQDRQDERAAVVEWLRGEAQICDCFAREEGECACGAWDAYPGERSHKRMDVEGLADAIERGDHLTNQEQP